MLRTRELSIGYHKHPLMEGVELGLDQGQIIALIGPNGSGKSTLLKTLAGLLKPVEGTVFLDGEMLSKIPPDQIARKMSVMVTERRDTGYITCYEAVGIGRFPYTDHMGRLREEDKQQIEKAMALTGATELKDRLFSQISDGQKQRVLLARALVQQPKVMILDEPTSYLDIGYKIELVNILRRLSREEHIGILLSMHEMELVKSLADQVICITDGGGIERMGRPDEVLTDGYIEELFHIPRGQFREIYQ